MCLGIPGRVTEIWGDGDLVNGRVDFGGVSREVCLSYVPEVTVGEYVIVHVGFAISVLDEEEARRTLEILTAMGDLVTTELASDTDTTAGGPNGDSGGGPNGDTGGGAGGVDVVAGSGAGDDGGRVPGEPVGRPG